jgi:hypothetical protein
MPVSAPVIKTGGVFMEQSFKIWPPRSAEA